MIDVIAVTSAHHQAELLDKWFRFMEPLLPTSEESVEQLEWYRARPDVMMKVILDAFIKIAGAGPFCFIGGTGSDEARQVARRTSFMHALEEAAAIAFTTAVESGLFAKPVAYRKFGTRQVFIIQANRYGLVIIPLTRVLEDVPEGRQLAVVHEILANPIVFAASYERRTDDSADPA